MLIGASLIIMIIIVLFNLILGNDFLGGIAELTVDNEALIDGISTTFVVPAEHILFTIDTSTIIGAITIISITLIAIAGVTGISVLGSGLNPQSARIIILAITYTGIWVLLSTLAFALIISIEVFGSVIYVAITIAYVLGVIQSISGSGGGAP